MDLDEAGQVVGVRCGQGRGVDDLVRRLSDVGELAHEVRLCGQGTATLGERLTLPPGWVFRAVVLDADLVLTPENGQARITQDDFGNVYDRAGGPFSNYRP